MKKFEWMFAWLVALIITLAIVYGLSCQQKVQERESILQNAQGTILTLTARIDKISNSIAKIPADYTDKIEQLTRENEQLIMENRALKDYIKGFGFWKEAE